MKSAIAGVTCAVAAVFLPFAASSAEVGKAGRHYYSVRQAPNTIYDANGQPLGNVLQPGQKYWENGVEKHCIYDWLCSGGN
jgi:hypothetical protein